jgi:Rieske 2Fe-2S family protein
MTVPVRSVPGTADAAIAKLVACQPAGHSLSQSFYVSEVAFQVDIDRVFMRHWLLVGHASSAPKPGDYFLCEIAEESVIIARGKDDLLRAFLNICRHRGSRICTKSEGHAEAFVCPYHAWAYNLDGTLRGARYMPADFDKSLHGLKAIHIEVIEGLVFISFADKPLGLETVRSAVRSAHGPYGWAAARVAHRETYPIESNWKLAVENYLECYHCAPAHPEYSKLHALEQPLHRIEALNVTMEVRTCALGVNIPHTDRWVNSGVGEEAIFSFRYSLYEDVKTGSRNGQPVAPLMGDFRDYDGGVTSTHLGPASFFIAYPDHGVLYRFVPKTVSTCEIEVVWLVRGDAREGVDYALEELTWLWQVTTAADKRIIQNNQKGVNSRFYQSGPYAPMEHTLMRYVAWYLNEISS